MLLFKSRCRMALNAAAKKRGGLQFWENDKEEVNSRKNNANAAAAGAAERRRNNLGAAAGAAVAGTSWRQYLVGTSGSSSGFLSDGLRYTLYLAVSLFILFIILTLIHFTIYPVFSFSPGDGGFLPVPTFSDAVEVAKEKPNPPEKALAIPGVSTCGYSVAFDLNIPADFTNLQTPRVLLYRSTTAVGGTGTAPAHTVSSSLSQSKEAAIKSYENYFVSTYPNTNLIVWLDPTLNDLYVSAVLSVGSGSEISTHIVSSDPVENLPTGKQIRVAIVFTELFTEIYVDGRLKQTKVYKPSQGGIKDIGADKSFFTTPNISGSSVAPPEMKRISFWLRPITAGEAMAGV